jgi:hypothetical protein
MKQLILSLAVITTLSGCAGPLGTLYRIFPDGASVEVDELSVNGNAVSGSVLLKGVRWTGTNGFPIPGTNGMPIINAARFSR